MVPVKTVSVGGADGVRTGKVAKITKLVKIQLKIVLTNSKGPKK